MSPDLYLPRPHLRNERPQSNPAMPRLAAALREGLLDGQGLPRAGMRKLRYVDEVDHPTTEADQIGFGRTATPAQTPRSDM
jgi:hypothetical protein